MFHLLKCIILNLRLSTQDILLTVREPYVISRRFSSLILKIQAAELQAYQLPNIVQAENQQDF